MGENIKEDISRSLRDYLNRNLGLNFNERQNKELFQRMDQASLSFGFPETDHFVNWILHNQLQKNELSKLAGYLTIGETYFMREKKGFDFLEQIYLPGLIHKRLATNKKLRVWCAGCATGEEAYSLAIVLQQSIPKITEWDVSILATDINPVFLEKAKKGIYTKWSFRNNSDTFIKDYFIKTNTNEYQIIPEIKKMVNFDSLNLASDDYPSETNNTSAIDIIFCRNVLIYFSNEGIGKVTERIYHSLKEGGVLVVSPVEMSNLICRKFNSIYYSGFTIYQKSKNKTDEKLLTDFQVKPNQETENQFQYLKKTVHKPIAIPVKTARPKIPTPISISKVDHSKENTKLNFDFEKVKLLCAQGAFEEAEYQLSNYLNKIEKPELEVVVLMAKAKANQGKLTDAEIWCAKGLSLNKLDPNLHYLLATIMQETGNDEKAIAALKMALYLEPNFVLAHFLMGNLLSKNGDTTASKKAFKNALASLSRYAVDDILPESEGITVGRFASIINSITN